MLWLLAKSGQVPLAMPYKNGAPCPSFYSYQAPFSSTGPTYEVGSNVVLVSIVAMVPGLAPGL